MGWHRRLHLRHCYPADWYRLHRPRRQGLIRWYGVVIWSSYLPRTHVSFSFKAWYQWYPEPAYDFEDIIINAGDQILLIVSAPYATTGTALIVNLSTGQSVSQSLTSSYHLCQTSAEWIVEDAEQEQGDLLPFADFGTVIFSSAQALTASGVVGPSNAENILDIRQNNQILTSTYLTSNSVTVMYAQA